MADKRRSRAAAKSREELRRENREALERQKRRRHAVLVIGLVAAAALLLIRPTNFIDSASWIIFAVVAFFTVLPNFIRKKEHNRLSTVHYQLSMVLSHPILLIILAGMAGYFIYS